MRSTDIERNGPRAKISRGTWAARVAVRFTEEASMACGTKKAPAKGATAKKPAAKKR
jgi:hypothetical protein